jgi:galactonate dehydratase
METRGAPLGLAAGGSFVKITNIIAYPVWVATRNQMLVKVETDEGISGWGESGLSGREQAVAGAIEHYREWLIGRDPMRIGALWQEMYRSQYFEGGRVLLAAQSALDVAFHDIKGKALGVPVYELLGVKHRDYIDTFASTPALPGQEMIDQAQGLKDAGWKAVRFFPRGQDDVDVFEPRESIATTAEWCTKAREALGDEIVLGIDYHHRLSVAETASFCQKMPSGTLDFLEEPIRDESPEAYEALRKMVDVPFAIGEEFASKWQFLPYIERGITQFARIDVCNVGGLTEAMKVAGWCEAHYIDMMPHNPLGPVCTAASIHFCAAIANMAWQETRTSRYEKLGFDSSHIFPAQPQIEGARFPVPTTPGLGIEPNEEYLKAQSYKFWEAPHLKRRDGSVTNW